MRIARYISQDNSIQYGWIDGDRIGSIQGNPFGEYRRFEAKQKLNEVKLLAPCEPSKIIVVAHNYAYKFEDVLTPPPAYPIFSFKPSSSLISSGDPILLPPQSRRVEHEAELAVVIAKKARWLKQEEVKDVIFGYTIANDITARDLEISDGHSSRSKGFDTFCPLGPWIETDFDPSDAIISCNVNTAMRQMASTRDMHFSIDRLLMFISSVMTLMPGDLILTGTPNGSSILEAGDIVTVNIEGIGNLVNPVQSARP
jgi:2-keto-4-pentenoate hydratase/2-oxohepta-3-ene-1,7-dioic acid hydratase in catechol pathway